MNVEKIKNLEGKTGSLKLLLTTLYCWESSENNSQELLDSIFELKKDCLDVIAELHDEMRKAFAVKEEIAKEQIEETLRRR